jgi:hypothetical protein
MIQPPFSPIGNEPFHFHFAKEIRENNQKLGKSVLLSSILLTSPLSSQPLINIYNVNMT